MQAIAMPESALLARAHANHVELARAMARLRPEGVIEEADGLILIRSGHALPHFNFAAALRVPLDPDAVLSRVHHFFAPFGLRYMLTATAEAAAAIGPVAAARGMTPATQPGMLLAPLSGNPATVDGLTMRAVTNREMLRTYHETMSEGFGGGPWALPEALDDPALLQMPDATHYVGFIENRPVGTAARFSSHRIAGIVNVSTIAAYRRRGIGEAMTWRAALDGRDEGCIAAFLYASNMGHSLYQQMGFRQIETRRAWLSPGGE